MSVVRDFHMRIDLGSVICYRPWCKGDVNSTGRQDAPADQLEVTQTQHTLASFFSTFQLAATAPYQAVYTIKACSSRGHVDNIQEIHERREVITLSGFCLISRADVQCIDQELQ